MPECICGRSLDGYSLQDKSGMVERFHLAGGFSKVSVVDGEDEGTTHQITCPGMEVGDEVVAVLVLTTAASIATLAAHAGTLTAAVDKITPGTEVDNSGNQYVIFWTDLTWSGSPIVKTIPVSNPDSPGGGYGAVGRS